MIFVFGSINIDLVARIERLPRPGETIAGIAFAMLPGGKGANQALAARRAGADVAMAGAVGTDPFAAAALSGLVAAGVDVARVRRDAAPTGVALIHVEASGQNAITVIPGANASVQAAGVPDAALRLRDHSSAAARGPVRRRLRHRVTRARCGARVVLNAAPAQALPASLLASVDVLVVNAIEAATLAAALGLPDAPEGFASALHRRHGCAVVVTLGPARRDRRRRREPVHRPGARASTSSTPQVPATPSSARWRPRSTGAPPGRAPSRRASPQVRSPAPWQARSRRCRWRRRYPRWPMPWNRR